MSYSNISPRAPSSGFGIWPPPTDEMYWASNIKTSQPSEGGANARVTDRVETFNICVPPWPNDKGELPMPDPETCPYYVPYGWEQPGDKAEAHSNAADYDARYEARNALVASGAPRVPDAPAPRPATVTNSSTGQSSANLAAAKAAAAKAAAAKAAAAKAAAAKAAAAKAAAAKAAAAKAAADAAKGKAAGQRAFEAMMASRKDAPAETQDHTLLYVAGGVVFASAIAAVIYFKKRT